MDKIDLIQKLFAAFPNASATPSTFAAYLETLEEIPLDELAVVVKQCMREGGNFPPSAGQVMQRWQATSATPTEGAERGWLSVQMAMRDPLNYVPEPSPFVPNFRDPVVRKVVAAMGWYNLRMSEQPRVDQAQFIKMYNAFVERATQDQLLSNDFKQLRDVRRNQLEDHTNGIVVKRLQG